MRMVNGWNTKKKIMSDRKRLKPIDVDWTMEMIDEISAFLASKDVAKTYKTKSIDVMAPLFAIDITVIVDEHINKNGYELRKIEKHD